MPGNKIVGGPARRRSVLQARDDSELGILRPLLSTVHFATFYKDLLSSRIYFGGQLFEVINFHSIDQNAGSSSESGK